MMRVYLADMNIRLGDYVVTLDYAGSDEPPRSWSVLPHSHANFELHTMSRGSGKLMTKGGVYEIGAGTTYLTGPEVYHSQYTEGDETMDERALRFDIRYSPRNGSDGEVSELIKALVENPFFVCREDIGCFETIGEMLDEARARRVGYREKLKNRFAGLLIDLGRYCMGAEGVGVDSEELITVGEPDLRAMLDNYFVGADFFAPPEQIIGELHITRRHFSRLMQQYYGMNYTDKVNEIRCEYAKELLAGELPVSEIWQRVGYSSQQYFSRVFKQLTGMTPTEYRSVCRKSE